MPKRAVYDIRNYRVVCSPLTHELYVARFGTDPRLALDKRRCEPELFAALIEHMFELSPIGTPKVGASVSKEVSFGVGHKYRVTVERVPDESESTQTVVDINASRGEKS